MDITWLLTEHGAYLANGSHYCYHYYYCPSKPLLMFYHHIPCTMAMVLILVSLSLSSVPPFYLPTLIICKT